MLSTVSVAIILLSFLSIISTIIGVILAFYFKKSKKGIVLGIGFSAGIMTLISFFELLPESINEGGLLKSAIALISGFLFIGILNFVIPHTHLIKKRDKTRNRLLKVSYLIAFGLILHDFPEGFAMANSYIHSPSMGLLIALAIAVHNIPEEFAMSVPLLLAKKKKLLLKVAIISALAEPAGAIAGLIAVKITPDLNSFFMAFAAGTMIFISVHELFPMSHRYKNKKMFILGIVLSIFIYIGLNTLLPE